MTPYEIIVERFGPQFCGTFILLGRWHHAFDYLLSKKWKGTHAHDDAVYTTATLNAIRCELGTDPHFVKLMDGYWVKAVTVQEIINQFPGPYDLIWIDVPEKNRALWYTDQVQAAFRSSDQTDTPFMCVVPEDGHNEGLEIEVRRKGYRFIHREDGFFFMGTP